MSYKRRYPPFEAGGGASVGLATVLGVSADADEKEITNAGAATAAHSLCTLEQAAAIANAGTGVDLTTFLADGWAWDNQGASTLTQVGNAIKFYIPPSTYLNARHVGIAVPAAEYQLTVRMAIFAAFGTNYHGGIVGWKAATGGAARLSSFYRDARNGGSIRYFDQNTQTTGGTEADVLTYLGAYSPVWLRLHDTNGATPSVGTVTWSTSLNGIDWIPVRVINKATGFLSATGYNRLIIGGNAEHATQETLVYLNYYKLETL